MRREDMVLGAFILVPILCLIIPVPLFLLDLLFALNIAPVSYTTSPSPRDCS